MSRDLETWKDIKGFEGLYQVSNHGNVRSLPREVPMRPAKDGKYLNRMYRVKGGTVKATKAGDYFQVVLCRSGKETIRLIHRLVLDAFIGNCPEGMECRHLDGNPENNVLSNLVWGTHGENQADRVQHGTSTKGIIGNTHKLSKESVEKMKELWGSLTIEQLARMFGVSKTAVSYNLHRTRKEFALRK